MVRGGARGGVISNPRRVVQVSMADYRDETRRDATWGGQWEPTAAWGGGDDARTWSGQSSACRFTAASAARRDGA